MSDISDHNDIDDNFFSPFEFSLNTLIVVKLYEF